MAVSFKLKRSSISGRAPATSSLDYGELAVNTYDGVLYLKKNDGNGDTVVSIGGGISNVVEDTTPQLGGNLDLNSKTINGTGSIVYTGGFLNTGGHQTNLTSGDSFSILGSLDNPTVSINSTGGIFLNQGGVGSIRFFNEYSFPTSDGTNGQVLTTNGSGTLSFTTPASGGISNVVEDTTPQLGGDLDVNGNTIHGSNAVTILGAYNLGSTNSPGEVYIQGLDGNSIGNGTVHITGVGGWPSGGTGRVNINWSGNNGQAYGDTYIGSINGGAGTGFYDNAVYINDSKFPLSRGSNGQVLTTDGAGILSWANASGGISNLVEDTTPQLGGDLDMNGKNITGLAVFKDVVYLQDGGQPPSIGLYPVTGDIIAASLNGIVYPSLSGDGTAGQVLTTDGSGTLSFTTPASGGISNLVEDTTPQLGGTLDTNGNNIGSGSSNIGFYTSGYGGVSGNLIVTNTSNKLYLQRGQLILTDTGDAPLYIKANDNMTEGASGWTMTLPAGPGTDGQVMTTDGAGNLSFADAASGGGFDVVATTTLDNPNAYSTSAGDNFGYAVAVDGNYAIIGAGGEDDAGGTNSAKAYIFDTSTGSLVHTLDNPNPTSTSASDYFGRSVSISGNNAIVGAYGEDPNGSSSGNAYVFDVTTGSLVYTLNNPNAYNTGTSDLFGLSVAISGNYAIVGAYGEDDAGGLTSGKAYIYYVPNGSLIHTLNNPNAYGGTAGDQFGYSVAISGNYAIVGARAEDDASGTDSGKAYIFNVTTGSLVHTLDNPNPYSTSAYDEFGVDVAISGNYAIVGAYAEDDAAGSASGKAYIYNVTTGALVHTLDNPNPIGTGDNDWFGYRVSISGNYAIVGANREDQAINDDSGKAYIFDVTTGALVYTLENPTAYGTGQNDFFGNPVAISNNRAIVGAYQEDDAGGVDSGKAYIFELALPFDKVADDPAPQLGANLDTKDFSITNTGAPDDELGVTLVDIDRGIRMDGGTMTAYDGAGALHIETNMDAIYIRSAGDFSTTYPAYLFGMSGNSQANASFSISGTVSFDNYTFPHSDGTAGQVLTTDGSGTLSFADAGGGGSFADRYVASILFR